MTTVKELIEKLKTLPEDYKVQATVNRAYTSHERDIKVYIDEYAKSIGHNVVTIES